MTPDARHELLRREEDAWAAFVAEVDRVPRERLEVEGVVEGWSVKDVVWHCAYWARFCAEVLESTGGGEFPDPFGGHDDAHWDAVNGRVAEEGKQRPWASIRGEADEIRDRVRAALRASAPGAATDELFAEETAVHYEEHAVHVRDFVGGDRDATRP